MSLFLAGNGVAPPAADVQKCQSTLADVSSFSLQTDYNFCSYIRERISTNARSSSIFYLYDYAQ